MLQFDGQSPLLVPVPAPVPEVVEVTPLTVEVDVQEDQVFELLLVFEVGLTVFVSHSSPNRDAQKVDGWQFLGFVVEVFVFVVVVGFG